MFDAAPKKVAFFENELRTTQNILYVAEKELTNLRYSLNDLIATKANVELEIRRAIALREAEFYAAKSRFDLAIMLLAQLKATEEMLRAEIEQAKMEAIARAAREREALLRAEEEERLRLAAEQRIIVEQELAEAQLEAGLAVEEREKLRLQAELELARFTAEAERIAKEREEQARIAAEAEAQAVIARINVIQASKKPVAVEAAPAIGLIALISLGILALAGKGEKKPTTLRGKYLAKKTKK